MDLTGGGRPRGPRRPRPLHRPVPAGSLSHRTAAERHHGTIYQRLNGAISDCPCVLAGPEQPRNTGIALPKAAAGYDDEIVNPRATQFTAGYTVKLGSTGLFADVEAST